MIADIGILCYIPTEMSKIFKDVKIKIDDDLEKHLEWLMPQHGPYRILRKSVDARQKHSPHFVYTIEVADENETLSLEKFELPKASESKIKSRNFQKRSEERRVGKEC